MEELDSEPTLEELRKAIDRMACGKAPGSGTPPDNIKRYKSTLLHHLHIVLCQCWREGAAPQNMRDTKIIALYKNKGDRIGLQNHLHLSRLEQDRLLLLAVIEVNPWSPHLYARAPDAWKAVCEQVRSKFTCYENYARKRVALLLNKYGSEGRPHFEDTADTSQDKHESQQHGEDTKINKEKPTSDKNSPPDNGESGEGRLTLEALVAEAWNKRQQEEDRIMEDWMKKMLRKHTDKGNRSEKQRSGLHKSVTVPSPGLQCPVCKARFETSQEATALTHFGGHLADLPNECSECHQSISSRHDFVQHVRVHLLRPSKYKNQQCDVCGEVFQGSLKSHLLKHGVNLYNTKTCGVCGYSTRKASVLAKHLRTHSGEKLFLCDLCPKAYTTSVYLKEHKLAIHERENKFYCDMCTKSFYTRLRLRRHIKTHCGEKPFNCDQCGRGFTTAYNLRTHQRLHTGVKPYQCKLCEAAFVQKTSLDCHMKKHGIIMQRRPRSCDSGPDKQDQTDFLTRNHPSQFFEQFKDTWPGRPKRAASTATTNQPVQQPLSSPHFTQPPPPPPPPPPPASEESRPRSPAEGARNWSGKTVGGVSTEEGAWPSAAALPLVTPIRPGPGSAWNHNPSAQGASQTRDYPWTQFLPPRPNFSSKSAAASLPQEFSFSAAQSFARASGQGDAGVDSEAASSASTTSKEPVFAGHVGTESSQQNTDSAYPMILHY